MQSQLENIYLLKSVELRAMRDVTLLQQKGKGRATYYIADSGFNLPLISLSTPVISLSAPAKTLVHQLVPEVVH